MTEEIRLNIIVADTAPLVLAGFAGCLRKLSGLHVNIIETTSKSQLMELARKNDIDLVIVNPTFGGYFNPMELRNISLNSDLKIFTIEMGKLPPQVLSLYDDSLHITDDLNAIGDKIKRACSVSQKSNVEEKETLSNREKEIVSYVVKGFTNQEIADKLFLSVHTVITHRRNIAKKLEIHSATGLTIYAIVNKIVDLSEIKI